VAIENSTEVTIYDCGTVRRSIPLEIETCVFLDE
jgi:hypothetical protein